ncbi:hypothetical protein DFH11DRAFT_1182664 [Phellopilus nigrolimitatus]|nr:hypothetical protein DFH11DRAFT_1182664 [Phellopilus nigrolimitatus]
MCRLGCVFVSSSNRSSASPIHHLRPPTTATGATLDRECTMSASEPLSIADSDQDSLYSVSTNATADNLPGPGRTLGLFYSFAGRHVEVQLGRLAGRLGHGPQAIALRIRKNSLAYVLPLPKAFVKTKNSEIEKDCKRLLKYVGSNAPSTRGQALEGIIDLSFDHHVRDLLKVMGTAHVIELAHKDLFSRSDYNTSLSNRSRTALVSVTDDMFMQEIKDFNSSYPKIFLDQASIVWTYARWVAQGGLCDVCPPAVPILDYMSVVVDTSPDWE